MANDEHNYDDHKVDARGPGDNILKALADLAMDQKRAELTVAKAEEALNLAKAELKRIAETDIPKLMDEAEMTEYTTKDGVKIKISEKIRGSIPKANEVKAFEWLKENKHDDLIKREFKIQFNKDEEAWAAKFVRDLNARKKKLAYEVKRAVHPSTLASFVKGQLEAGVDFPLDIFGVFRQRVSEVEVKE